MIPLADHRIARGQPAPSPPLPLARELFHRLNTSGVRYCQWKSNEALAAALSGQGDLDLLIHAEDTDVFRAVLAKLEFKLAAQPRWQAQSSVVHYYGCDQPSGRLLHLHVYYRLVTGGQIVKNYRLPLEPLLFTSSGMELGVVVPSRAAELTVLVIRKMLEAGSCCELVLQSRVRDQVQRELWWLLGDGSTERAALCVEIRDLLGRFLPQLDPVLWQAGLECLVEGRSPLVQRRIGVRFCRELRGFRIHGPLASQWLSAYRAARLAVGKLWRRGSGKWLACGGLVVALIGPEASGKSTLSQSLCQWLSPTLAARTVHLGKPRSTWAGRCAAVARRLRRWLRPPVDSDSAGTQADAGEARSASAGYAVASVLLARERYCAAVAAARAAGRGAVVVCDRYPARQAGAIDGPRLTARTHQSGSGPASWFYRLAAQLELAYYRRLPQPDVVVRLDVPVTIAQQRNRQRVKPDKESDMYLSYRHERYHSSQPHQESLAQVDTTRPVDEVVAQLRRIVWRNLT